jgi:hypothetical protein
MSHVTSLLGAALLLAAGTGYAQTRSQVYGDQLTQQAQTVYLRADAGMSTYESQAAGSKETRPSSVVTMGGWAGEARSVGASVTASDAAVPFSLNDSKMRTSFRDIRLMARMGWIIPSIGASLSEIDVDKGGEHTLGLYGTGVNAGLAIAVPVARFMVVQADGMVVQSNKIYDKLGQNTKLGQRVDGDISMSYDLTERMLDLLVGYRIRQYAIDTGEVTYKEKSQGAYAGLRLGFYF